PPGRGRRRPHDLAGRRMMQATHIEGNRWRVIDGDDVHNVFVPAGLDDEAGAAAAIAALQPPAPEVVAAWALDAAKDRLKARRDRAIAAGITIGDVTFATDDLSQQRITGAALAASLDPDLTINWKTDVGFVPLDAATIISV